MYFMRADKMLELIQRAEMEDVQLDADKLIEHYLPEYQVSTYEYTGYLADIDSIPAYFNANMEMLEKNKFSALVPRQPKRHHKSEERGTDLLFERGTCEKCPVRYGLRH